MQEEYNAVKKKADGAYYAEDQRQLAGHHFHLPPAFFAKSVSGEACDGAIGPSADTDQCLGRSGSSLMLLTAKFVLSAHISVRLVYGRFRGLGAQFVRAV
jgi:hypothetical protein